jgi:hypothetical protein
MEPAVRGARTRSGITAAPAHEAAPLQAPELGWLEYQRSGCSAVSRSATAAGNGIFGCRDRAPKTVAKMCDDLAQLIAGIVVREDRLIVRLRSDTADEAPDCADDRSLTIPWQKPPSKRSRQILLPHKKSRSEVRPEQFERRARLVSAIARGRRWLDEVVSGRVTTVAQLCAREKCRFGRSI